MEGFNLFSADNLKSCENFNFDSLNLIGYYTWSYYAMTKEWDEMMKVHQDPDKVLLEMLNRVSTLYPHTPL